MNYITDFYIYEQDLKGTYNTEPHEYRLETKEIPISENMDILFEACEIERIYNGKIWVEKQTCQGDNYIDSDEAEFEVNIKLSNELSDFINWDKCRKLPPIYKIDRENSTIKMII